jgi:hypothetical protein
MLAQQMRSAYAIELATLALANTPTNICVREALATHFGMR